MRGTAVMHPALWAVLAFAVFIALVAVAVGVGKWLEWLERRHEPKRWWWV